MRMEPVQAVESWQDTGIAGTDQGPQKTRMSCRNGNWTSSAQLETGGSVERCPRSPHPFGAAR